MEAINQRFREIRKSLKKNQEEWGGVLGITRSGVADIEAGRRNVTEKHIKFLCIEPISGKYVNENWLRTGEGDMFKQLPEEDEIAVYVSNLLEEPDNPLYELILEIMRTYSDLSPKSQEILREFSVSLRDNLAKRKEG